MDKFTIVCIECINEGRFEYQTHIDIDENNDLIFHCTNCGLRESLDPPHVEIIIKEDLLHEKKALKKKLAKLKKNDKNPTSN